MSEENIAPEVPKPLSLSQKILQIQDAVGVVKKQGQFGSEMGGGKYLRIEDAVVAVNKLLTAKKLILTGTLISSERLPHEKGAKDATTRSGYITSVLMNWTVLDTETEAFQTWTFPGDGYDSTDKGVYKAMTGCRNYAIINIFNLPIGNDVEEHGTNFEEGKEKQKRIAASKIADAAGRGNKEAIEAMSQLEPEKKIIIKRPEEMNGHYVSVEGLIAVPQLERFFEDTNSKRFKRKTDLIPYWRVPAEYEKGLVDLCGKLNIEVEG